MPATKQHTDKMELAGLVHDSVRPERSSKQLQVSEPPAYLQQGRQSPGITVWDNRGKVRFIGAPLGQGAYHRTVRIHETLHANHSPIRESAAVRKCSDSAIQAIEDVRVHGLYWPVDRMPLAANRDCLATALTDLRSIATMDASKPEQFNYILCIYIRAYSILWRLSRFLHDNIDRREKLQMIIDKRISIILPLLISYKLDQIASKAATFTRIKKESMRFRLEAIQALDSLLIHAPKDEPKKSHKPKLHAEPTKGECKATDHLGAEDMEAVASTQGASAAQIMRIQRLPLSVPTQSSVPTVQLSRSGMNINRSRLARLIATKSTAGLFRKRLRREGGSFCLDASGSMGVSSERLAAIASKLPAALIAYYNGGGISDDGSYGELNIFAQNGLRSIDAPINFGGNAVDLYAIQWLLSQPSPRYLVTDGGFGGGPDNQGLKASILLMQAVADGRITLYHSYTELCEALDIDDCGIE